MKKNSCKIKTGVTLREKSANWRNDLMQPISCWATDDDNNNSKKCVSVIFFYQDLLLLIRRRVYAL